MCCDLRGGGRFFTGILFKVNYFDGSIYTKNGSSRTQIIFWEMDGIKCAVLE
jgi:hypothetical protein